MGLPQREGIAKGVPENNNMPARRRPYPYTPAQLEVLEECAKLLSVPVAEIHRRAGRLMAESMGLEWPEK